MSATGKKCYRCQGPVEKHDLNWSFLGSWFTSQSTTTYALRVKATTVRHRDDGPRPFVMDDRIDLCHACMGLVMKFIGVGKRPKDRATEAQR